LKIKILPKQLKNTDLTVYDQLIKDALFSTEKSFGMAELEYLNIYDAILVAAKTYVLRDKNRKIIKFRDKGVR
jgi:hypothetical protein